METDGFLPIGKIVGVHGIRGSLKVWSYAESPSVFQPGQSLVLISPRGQRNTYELQWVRPHKRVLLMALKGIANRTQAEPLVDSEFLIERASFPPLEEGTYYWADLIGLSVFTTDDDYMGRVHAIIPTGSNDVYVVKDLDKEILIPALESVVIAIDLENRTMKVELPEGLL